MTKPSTSDPRLLVSHTGWDTAMKSVDHLKQWLDASGRRWLVFNALDLADALTYPEGHETFRTLVEAYRDHRRTIDSGRTETLTHPATGKAVEVPVFKDESLEIEELDRAIRYLVSQMYARNPTWSLDSDSL